MNTESICARKYAVFISYRHADNKEMGRKWANWLHEALESYEIPPDLIGTNNLRGDPVPASLYPVFRDEEELPADADLTSNIHRALENSGLLVVLCSPRAVQSRFVADEIHCFKELGKSDRILALIIDGEPNASDDPTKTEAYGSHAECFPERLRFGVAADDIPKRIDWAARTEPIAADVRPASRPEQGWTTAAAYQEQLERECIFTRYQIADLVRDYAERLELAKLKIIAGALGLPLGKLTQRDKSRQLHRARRRTYILTGLAAFFAVMVGVAVILGMMARVAQKEAETQQRTTASLLLQAEERNRISSRTDRTIALDLEAKDRPQDALAYLARSIDYDPASSRSAEVAVYLLNTNADTLCLQTFAKTDILDRADLSLDGTRVITTRSPSIYSGIAQVWDAATGLPVGAPMEMADRISLVRFSPDTSIVITASAGGIAQFWNASTGRRIGEPMPHDTFVQLTLMVFSPDSKLAATATFENTVRVLDAVRGGAVAPPTQHPGKVNGMVFSPDNSLLAIAIGDHDAKSGYAQIYEAATGKTIGAPMAHHGAVNSVGFNADGTHLVTASMDKTVRVWDARTGLPLGKPMSNKYEVSSAVFSPDGTRIMSHSVAGLAMWDAETHNSLAVIGGSLKHAHFSPDGLRISGVDISSFGVWSATTLQKELMLERLYGDGGLQGVIPALSGVSLVEGGTPPGHLLLERTAPAVLARRVLWDDFALASTTLQPQALIYGCGAFSPDGARFIKGKIGEGSNPVQGAQLWDVTSGRTVGSFLPLGKEARSVGFSPDGTQVIVVADRKAQVWDTQTGKTVGPPIQDEDHNVTSAAFSPDGTRIVTGSTDKAAQVWDAKTAAPIGPRLRHGDDVNSACFSPDGTKILTASRDQTARLWDATTGKGIGSSFRESDKITGAIFNADGTCVLTLTEKYVRVWSVGSGALVGQPIPIKQSRSVCFSPDGKTVLTNGGGLQITEVLTGHSVFSAQNLYFDCAWFAADGSRLLLSDKKQVTTWELLGNAGPPPRWFSDFLRIFARCLLTDDGRLEKFSPEVWRQLRANVTPLAMADASRYGQIAQWFLLPDDQRPTRPGATTTAFAAANSLITLDADVRQLRQAYDLNPDHPLIHLALAKFETNPKAAIFLQRYDLDRLPKTPGKSAARLWLRAVQWLMESPASDLTDVIKAARQAAVLAPDDPTIQELLKKLQATNP